MGWREDWAQSPAGQLVDLLTLGPTRRALSSVGDYTIVQPLSGQTFLQTRPLSEPELLDHVASLQSILGLSDYQASQLITVGRGNSVAYLQDLANKMVQQNAVDEAAGRLRSETDTYYGKAIGRAEGEASRLGGLLTTPGAIRTDAEYGTALAEAENAINAEVRDVMRSTAAATPYSGLRGGNMAKNILETRLEAGSRRGAAQASLRSDIASRKSGYEQYADTLGASRLSANENLARMKLGALPSWNVQEEGVGPQLSAEYARRSSSQNAFSTLLGAGMHAMDTSMNAMTSIMGMMKKG